MTTEFPDLEHHPRMVQMIRHQAIHVDLGNRATAFMQNFASVTESEGLIAATHQYCLGEKTPDATYAFDCRDAGPINVSELYAGALLMPAAVRVVFDVSATDHNISYSFRAKEQDGVDASRFQELTLIVANPRDTARASWQLVLSPLAPPAVGDLIFEEVSDDAPFDASEDDVALPVDGTMNRTNNSNFSQVTSAILESLTASPANGDGSQGNVS